MEHEAAEFAAIAERAAAENPDLAFWPEEARQFTMGNIVKEVASGTPATQAVDVVIENMRKVVGKPRPISEGQAVVDNEMERLNAERRSWGMR